MPPYSPPTTATAESNRESLNRADANSIADLDRQVALGDVVRAAPVLLQGVAALTAAQSTPPQITSTGVGAIVLPEDAKAALLLRVTVRKATAAAGEYAIQAYGTTPGTTQVAIAPNGDIVFLDADAVTQADILYIPYRGDVFGNLANSRIGSTRLTLNVDATGFAALPAPLKGKAILLMYANVTTGTVTGQKIILVPATAVTATTKAALAKDGSGIWFNLATDAPTQCQVDVLCYSGTGAGVDVHAVLENASGTI